MKKSMKKNEKKGFLKSWGWVVLLFVIVVSVAVYFSLSVDTLIPPAGSVGVETSLSLEISVNEAAAKREAGAFILDVREQEEWNAGHIPGATLIPLGTLSERLSEIPKDKEIVVVCRSGNRSAQGRDILLRNGFEMVTSMAGGMNQWAKAGLETVTGP